MDCKTGLHNAKHWATERKRVHGVFVAAIEPEPVRGKLEQDAVVDVLLPAGMSPNFHRPCGLVAKGQTSQAQTNNKHQ